MNMQFPLILAASGSGAALVFAILRKPLFRVVVDLCGTADRGRSWTLYTVIMLVLSPMLAVSFATSSEAVQWGDPLFVARCTLGPF
ncbi:hypothetical protein [Lichenifustis flavocetrariae]|uniref:Uncharacterized protein n=1 Tax=Lichenifustis flavocetrariae TaxID=2949735 RepID=A0AA42CKW7_9HYPH|nr:hypothetical protein [Lichenifustis flavocetrariae]MCW6511014.1 hypothetical protein [Lichenifustis flavocetrariae]